MAYILNIETATTNCSVSLSKEGEILVLKEDTSANYSHAELLHSYIEDALQSSNLELSDLDAISVSKGPGSYTGLRIGVSAAKGLCYGLDIPLISVDTLHSLSFQVTKAEGLIIPMLDARRMEVYSAIYDFNHRLIRETQAQILDETSFQEYLKDNLVYFIGNGVEKAQGIFNSNGNAFFVENKFPSAREMGSLAHKKFLNKNFEDVAYFEPYYLKEFLGLKS